MVALQNYLELRREADQKTACSQQNRRMLIRADEDSVYWKTIVESQQSVDCGGIEQSGRLHSNCSSTAKDESSHHEYSTESRS